MFYRVNTCGRQRLIAVRYPHSRLHLAFEPGSLPELGTHHSARVAAKRVPGTRLSLSPSAGVTGT